jgi:CRISPR-associated protein Csx10
MRYLVEVRTASPLAISARPTTPGLPTESQNYIPGTTLRGGIAAKLLRQGMDPESSRFRSLFLEGKVRYGNLYPVSRGRGLERELPYSLPLPATAMSCKWRPGFARTDVSPEAGHGVRDTLLAHLATDDLGTPRSCDHPGCEADLGPFGGFYETDGATLFRSASPAMRLISRTAIDSIVGTAKGGALYSLQAVNENQTFSGFLEADASVKDPLEVTLQRARLRLGSDRTRGLGDVEVLLAPVTGPLVGFAQGIEQRLTSFQTRLRASHGLGPELRERAGLSGDGWMIFPLTLYSDAIITDEYMRYQTAIDAGTLGAYSRCWSAEAPRWPDGTQLLRAFTSTSIRAGWNSAHRLPRERELIINRGSVFVFSAPEGDRDILLSCLQRLERDGIGERRDEGFGQIIVGHPFHLQEKPT